MAHRECTSESKAINQISRLAEGDLRKAYNILEVIVEGLSNDDAVSEDAVALFAKERSIRYDRDEDEHYDTASALIKSMRGNDPDASLYWLAKMLMGGEDPRFIARRLVIFASEDIGLADSRALLMADATFRACETIGLPECELNLAHCVLFSRPVQKVIVRLWLSQKQKNYSGKPGTINPQFNSGSPWKKRKISR